MTSYDEDRRVWSGPRLEPMFDLRRSAGDVVMELLRRNPGKPVQIDGDSGRMLTRDELRIRAVRIAQNLRDKFRLGEKYDEIVTIAALGSENLMPLTTALQFLAVPYNALYPHYTEGEMVHLMRQTQSRLLFCDASNYALVREAAEKSIEGELVVFVMDGIVEGARSVLELLDETGVEDQFEPLRVENTTKAIWSILCSSGTTGAPKGICLSHANRTSSYVFQNFSNMTILALGSIHWISVAYCYDLALFYNSVVVFTRKSFSPELVLDLLEKYRITAINCQPLFANAVAHHPRAKTTDLSSLALWGIGGYFVSDSVRDAIDAILPKGKSYTIYASTECGLIATDLFQRKRGAVGTVSPNMQIRVVDDDGNALGVGESGELLLKRSIPFGGYLKNEEATKAAFDDDGWFRSGDTGYFDEDGFLHLGDRKGDFFKYIDHVQPTTLEEIIAQVEGVEQVCVIGLPLENKSVELPTAVVVRNKDSEVSGEAIADYVAARVRDHMKLRGGVHFVDDLPLTGKGNVKRKELKRIMIDKLAEAN
ncbi:AAEL002680-PA [Aedes aegypti]|uniref:AAEL002680-PA n=2 Tax=Aedes aegypti TaxID=7159 RepID=A0A1S4F2G0_AEDAE|nr:probable 4-coumarate--CoA ligase 1 [Aedes aegypti]EAT46127.1 AAEL002680-PA [Aedes aegypti]